MPVTLAAMRADVTPRIIGIFLVAAMELSLTVSMVGTLGAPTSLTTLIQYRFRWLVGGYPRSSQVQRNLRQYSGAPSRWLNDPYLVHNTDLSRYWDQRRYDCSRNCNYRLTSR